MGHLLKITKLGVSFKTSEGRVNAVVEASLDVKRVSVHRNHRVNQVLANP